jgi:hypothetical protein
MYGRGDDHVCLDLVHDLLVVVVLVTVLVR